MYPEWFGKYQGLRIDVISFLDEVKILGKKGYLYLRDTWPNGKLHETFSLMDLALLPGMGTKTTGVLKWRLEGFQSIDLSA
jgi:hypothetical protein